MDFLGETSVYSGEEKDFRRVSLCGVFHIYWPFKEWERPFKAF